MNHTTHINNAEYNVLSLMLVNPDTQPYIFAHCLSGYFEDSINRKIFDIAKQSYDLGLEVDNVIIYSKCKNEEVNDRLVYLINDVFCTSPLLKKYCKILSEEYLKRLITNAKSKEDLAFIEEVKEKIDIVDVNIKHISDGAESFEDRYIERASSLLVTGYKELDKYLGSFCGGDYITLGGGTGIGKTSIALNLAKKLCEQDKKVLYCSLEMPIEQLRNRFNCMISGLNAMKYRNCGFSSEEFDSYKASLKKLDNWNLYVLCDYNLTVQRLKSYMQKQSQIGLDFVIIDYLGLLSGYGNKSLYERTSSISREIKILATDMNVPILVLVQLNREMKNRQDKRPVLSDIRESGAIEQDSDFVLFAHREGAYNPEVSQRELEIIIAKNRHGNSKMVCKLDFDLQTQLISDKTDSWYRMPKK